MKKNQCPDGFSVLSQQIPALHTDLKYCTADNIIGRALEGYAPDGVPILTQQATQSLAKIAAALMQPSICKTLNVVAPAILILDAYRPQMASEDFWQWSQTDCDKTKAAYFPNLPKVELFALGYFGRQSSHSRGSTIDLTIIETAHGKCTPIDMGTPFDFMDVLSHPDNKDVSPTAFKNRQFLRQLMQDFGWQGIKEEWWHFTLCDEPFPNTYFNFPVLNYEE